MLPRNNKQESFIFNALMIISALHFNLDAPRNSSAANSRIVIALLHQGRTRKPGEHTTLVLQIYFKIAGYSCSLSKGTLKCLIQCKFLGANRHLIVLVHVELSLAHSDVDSFVVKFKKAA